MYRLIYRVETNEKTREVEVYASKMCSALLEGVLKQFTATYPDELIIRAYLYKMELEP